MDSIFSATGSGTGYTAGGGWKLGALEGSYDTCHTAVVAGRYLV